MYESSKNCHWISQKLYDKNRPLDLGLLNFETIGLLGLRKDLQQLIVRQEVEASKAIPQQKPCMEYIT